MVAPLTTRQQAVLDFIVAFMRERQYSPSRREIVAALGLTSPGSAEYYLDVLCQKGHLVLMTKTCRAIRLTCPRCPYCGNQRVA